MFASAIEEALEESNNISEDVVENGHGVKRQLSEDVAVKSKLNISIFSRYIFTESGV